MTKIYLHGKLEQIFFAQAEYEVKTLSKAVRALTQLNPEISNYFLEEKELYRLWVEIGGEKIYLHQKNFCHHNLMVENASIHISPVVSGSGGIGKFFAGIALVGIGILTGGVGLSLLGASFALSAIAGGSPDAPNPEDDNKQSIIFNGASTTTGEGYGIPIIAANLYVVGGQLISFSIESEYTSL